MKQLIGSKYRETRSLLREGIRKGNIVPSRGDADNHACYFCRKRISGGMWVIEYESGKRGLVNSRVQIDNSCYIKSKIFAYLDDVPLSMN